MKFINQLDNNTFVALLVAVVLIVFVVGGYAVVKTVQNNERAAACEAQGGTSYGPNNWLCAK